MKKFVMVLLVIFIIALLILTGGMYQKMNEKDIIAVEQNEKVQDLEIKIAELENKIAEQENTTEEEGTGKDIEFNADKLKIKSLGCEYVVDNERKINLGINVKFENGKVYISTDVENAGYQAILPDVTRKIENEEITGFDKNISEVFVTYFGNGLNAPTILFLMEDGTVEYADLEKMLKEQNYKTEGKIKELSNIVKFVDVAVSEDDSGGYSSVVAIDEEGYSYDLNELIIK